jgi:cation:H+ antiporter
MVIGLTIVAIGTSLPELATSTVAAFKKESAISIGNIIGSNIFNILSVIGIVSIIKPITSPPELLKFEIPVMLAYGLVLIPLGLIKQPVNRINSLLMILGYIIFIFVLYT